jgi:hypothetical protein
MLKTFKSLALASAIALSSVIGFTAAPAEARECFTEGHTTVCFDLDGYDNAGRQIWNVVVDNVYTTERFIITCDGKRMHYWQSRGGATQAQADAFARAFCAL